MEACYAEGSKICYNSIPQILVGQLAHQNCIRRDRIVAPTSDDSGQSFGLAWTASASGPIRAWALIPAKDAECCGRPLSEICEIAGEGPAH
jgi:hypothetical protein